MDKENSKSEFKRNQDKTTIIVDGYTIKYHSNNKTIWSKGVIVDDQPHGYWQWYRKDGTLKRSGYFDHGRQIGEWTTYDSMGEVYKITNKDDNKKD